MANTGRNIIETKVKPVVRKIDGTIFTFNKFLVIRKVQINVNIAKIIIPYFNDRSFIFIPRIAIKVILHGILFMIIANKISLEA